MLEKIIMDVIRVNPFITVRACNVCFHETYSIVYWSFYTLCIIAGSVATLDTGKEEKNIKMIEYVSYEQPPSRIKTIECAAYGTLPNKP